ILDRTPVRFHCGCSRDRVERALKLLGAGELRDLLEQARTETVTLTCEFCRTPYPVPRDDLARLLLEVEEERGAGN
ncbi:MAG: redox-regulated molecular chaperone Hsp33, partial [Nitrospirae bacterium]